MTICIYKKRLIFLSKNAVKITKFNGVRFLKWINAKKSRDTANLTALKEAKLFTRNCDRCGKCFPDVGQKGHWEKKIKMKKKQTTIFGVKTVAWKV